MEFFSYASSTRGRIPVHHNGSHGRVQKKAAPSKARKRLSRMKWFAIALFTVGVVAVVLTPRKAE